MTLSKKFAVEHGHVLLVDSWVAVQCLLTSSARLVTRDVCILSSTATQRTAGEDCCAGTLLVSLGCRLQKEP